jgi:Zn ribbon nucleic-acid-binding protein
MAPTTWCASYFSWTIICWLLIQNRPLNFNFLPMIMRWANIAFYALGSTAAGAELHSNEIVRVFITKEESGQQVIGLVLPLLAGVAAVVTIMLLVMTLLGRKASFNGGYGRLGGAVCPQCGLPYALSFWAPSLVAGRLQRCPRCGKWALVRRARPEDLAAAEARWRGDAGAQETGEGQAERARRQIDDSRYVD